MLLFRNIFLLILLVNSFLFAQYKAENDGYLSNPSFTNKGIIATNNFGSAIYLCSESGIKTIMEAPGIGNYYSVSSDQNFIGVKIINENGTQVPAIINVSDISINKLSEPVKQCGQVSFGSNGELAFTIGTKLFVVSENNKNEYELGVYSNITPISPNGKFAAYNDLDDQIWIIDLSSGIKHKISDNKHSYFKPNWAENGSKILYSGLNGSIYIYDLDKKENSFIAEGFNPKWYDNDQSILFYKKEILNDNLINTDIYSTTLENKNLVKLTETEDVFEMDPVINKTGNRILYHTFDKASLITAELSENKIVNQSLTVFSREQNIIQPLSCKNNTSSKSVLDIPYLHQVWDTPDWHNGHWSCGPTASVMVLAYYNVLPPWPGWCSGPTGHTSYYGRYIAERYYFYKNDYRFSANDAGGHPAQGGYGFMWSSGSPHSKMRSYYSRHNVTSSLDDNPTYAEALTEINEGYPYTMCVMLTTAGHLIVANGLYMERTLSFNDPYGNKNTPSYPSYDGKNVKYDWPGYNNGYQNLNGVAWCVTNRKEMPVKADTLIDDLQFNNGFYLHNTGLASMSSWKDFVQGYKNHFWFRKTTSNFPTDTCYATWTPVLPKRGRYEVFAYIPFSNAEAALYKITHNNKTDTITINQSNFTEEWASLGTYDFIICGDEYVRLGDASTIAGQELVFDAVKFVRRDSIATSVESVTDTAPNTFELQQNYPNPFNPTTKIKFSVPNLGDAYNTSDTNVELTVYDLLGNKINTLLNEKMNSGIHEIEFNAGSLASGVYYYRLKAGNTVQSKKMILLK